MSEITKISIEAVKDDSLELETLKVEQMRRIRNTCYNYMTNNTSEISEKQQSNWWRSLDKDTYSCYVLYIFADSHVIGDVSALSSSFVALSLDSFVTPLVSPSINSSSSYAVGYGLIKNLDNKSLLTGGIIPNFRGIKLGRILFASLMSLSRYHPWLDVLITNTRAHRLYLSLGFNEVSRDERIIRMKYGEVK